MSWTADEALQEELEDPTVNLIAYYCDFCEAEFTRPEDKTTCPACHIGPMEQL